MSEKNKRGVPNNLPRNFIVIFGGVILLLCVASFGLCFMTTDCGKGRMTDLELTATSIVQTNRAVVILITQTAIATSAATVNAFSVPTDTPQILPTETPTYVSRSFSWANQDLPEVTDAAQAAIDEVDLLEGMSVRANAYGENCTGCADTVVFGAMTTDFYLTTRVEDLSDTDAIAELVIAAVDVLSAPLDVELPAPLGYFDLTLMADGETGNLRVMFVEIEQARTQGLTGSALIDELGGVRLR